MTRAPSVRRATLTALAVAALVASAAPAMAAPEPAGAPPAKAPPAAGAAAVPAAPEHHHLYWGGKLVDLEEFQVLERLPGESVSQVVQDAVSVWRVVDGRRLEGYDLASGELLREFELRGPCLELFLDERNVYAVLEEAVEVFPRDRAFGAQQIRFPDRRVMDATLLSDALAVLLDDTTAQLVDEKASIGTRIFEPEITRAEKRRGVKILAAPLADRVCRLEVLDLDYVVRCVDRAGVPQWEGGLRHTSVGPEGATRELELRRTGDRHLLFGSPRGAARPQTVVLSAVDGERVVDLPIVPGALLEGPDGGLIGLLTPEPAAGRVSLVGPDGVGLWTVPACAGKTAVEALTADDRLVVACWDPADSGGDLFAVALASGEPAWGAEVARLGRPRGAYTNEITLRRSGAFVVLEGHESALDHVQLFELTSGARRYVDARHKW